MMIFFIVGLLNFEEFFCLIINYFVFIVGLSGFDFFFFDRLSFIEVLCILVFVFLC